MITPINYSYAHDQLSVLKLFDFWSDPYLFLNLLTPKDYLNQLPLMLGELESDTEPVLQINEQPSVQPSVQIFSAIAAPIEEKTTLNAAKSLKVVIPTPDGKTIGTVSKSGRTSYILYNNTSPLPIDYVFNGKPLLSWDISDLMKARGITSVNGKEIKFGNPNRRTSSIGSPNSYHRNIDRATGKAMARDISINGGSHKDYDALRKAVLNDPVVRSWMNYKGWGIINEITRAALNKTGGTGNHFHFGPDRWAQRTWAKWQLNPDINVATILQKGGFIKNKFNYGK